MSENLKLKTDSKGNHYIDRLSQIQVDSPETVLNLVKKAQNNRASHQTLMNEASSRSHMILTITVNKVDNEGLTSAKLNIVDLAGSEKVKSSGSTGQQLKEACFINLSLFSLAKIVHALEKGKGEHLPYRDSKLTMLLKDSIGGNCKTTMIACISPS